MARTDAIVLGAGFIGTSIAIHLIKRGMSVALVDRRGPGEETSYGNTGIIEGNTFFPHPFPSGLSALVRLLLKRDSAANFHWSFLPRIAPWLLAYRANTSLAGSLEFAEAMRPLYAQSLAEHETLMAESGAAKYLRKTGWLKLYRSNGAFERAQREFEYASRFGLMFRPMDVAATQALEPSLKPAFRHAVHWPEAASVSNPRAVVQAYAARFTQLGGVMLNGDARSLHRNGANWRVDTDAGALDAKEAVVALGPWAPDLLGPLGIKLPMAFKRGYHMHYRAEGNAALARPIVDAENGYCLTPMEQGIRLTTGAEFAARDAAPTPVQLAQVLPKAKELFALGAAAEIKPWLGSRPCFADSRPVIGRAPGQAGLWLAIGHAHWGVTLGPVTGRLIAEMMTGATPFCDPAPYRAERFN